MVSFPRRGLLGLAALLPCSMLLAQTPDQAAIAIAAQPAVSGGITFTWPADATATGYTVSRRDPFAPSWIPQQTVPGGGAAVTWTDTSALLGIRYEYWFTKNGNPTARQFVSAGVDVPALDSRGTLLLLVDASKAAGLGTRLDRLQQDLVGDGWQVRRHDISPQQSVPSVKATIAAAVAAEPLAVKAVFLLGQIPVPYSGSLAPDGHIPVHQGAWPADLYYGELNGPWTDTAVNDTGALRPENHNVPGDGKFDQTSLPSDVELAVGRVDLSDLPAFAVGELALLQAYLDKDHAYRHKQFAVDQRAVVDDNFGWMGGEAVALCAWRNCWALVGGANTVAADYFGTLNTTTGGGHLWSFGCGSGSYTSAGGVGTTQDFAAATNRNVFTMLFGSAFGDWDNQDNFLRAPLAQGWTLASVWAGRPHWTFHPMGMGETIGACARQTMNETLAGGFSGRRVHIALMGDPTLRQHVVAPAANVVVTDTWPTAQVSWSASPDPVAGYHVYRATSPAGPFTRVSSALVTGTSFVDATPIAGPNTYMVRASKREVTPTGSYWNLAQGVFASTLLPSQPAAHTAVGVGCYAPSPLSLTASPAPVSTAVAGTTVGYTIGNAPEFAPGSGVRLGVLVLSLAGNPNGTSLAALGAPGCSLFTGGLDFTLAWTGNTATQVVPLTLPPGLLPGTRLYAAAAALFVPFSLPGGQNAFGAVTSNGIDSLVNSY